MSSPSVHACATYNITLHLLASPLTKWNLPVPCNIGRETRCIFQNWNGIFPTSEMSFTRGFMNELMTDSYLPTFKFQKEEQMREKNLKRGTFLNFLYITIQRLLQKQEHMIKSFSFLLRKEEQLASMQTDNE